MSLEKSRQESERWLAQARADLKAAEASAAAGSYEWACFQSQQASVSAIATAREVIDGIAAKLS